METYESEKFAYVWSSPPIDFWEGAIICTIEERERVMAQMPEPARNDIVLKTFMPGDIIMRPIYMCKADNNGSIYYFSDFDFISYYTKNWVIEDRRD